MEIPIGTCKDNTNIQSKEDTSVSHVWIWNSKSICEVPGWTWVDNGLPCEQMPRIWDIGVFPLLQLRGDWIEQEGSWVGWSVLPKVVWIQVRVLIYIEK